MLAKLILFLSFSAFAQNEVRQEGNVVYPVFGGKKKQCAALFGAGHQSVRPDDSYARKLYDSVLKTVDEQDPALVHMQLDFTSKIWEWLPTDKKNPMRIRFGRDENGRAVRAFVVRNNYLQDLIVDDLERVQELDDELRRRLPSAQVTVEDDLNKLHARPWPTAGLLL